MAEERLQKVLAAAGVASRRSSEEMIASGRVTVDGRTVTEMGVKVDPDRAVIAVDGATVEIAPRHTYIKLYKPRGVLSDIGGETRGRQTVADLLPLRTPRVFPVGRLDLNSEGLVLLTDDGELAHRLTHPRFEHPKTYYVLVAERPVGHVLDALRKGVPLADGMSAPAEVKIVPGLPTGLQLAPGPREGTWLEVVLREGKKRQIRHMTAAVGHPTLRLVRWAIGPLILGELKVGESSLLTRAEVYALRQAMKGKRVSLPQVGAPRRNVRGGGPPKRTARRGATGVARPRTQAGVQRGSGNVSGGRPPRRKP